MSGERSRCPKCAGQLFADDAPGDPTPDLACLQCGWRPVRAAVEPKPDKPYSSGLYTQDELRQRAKA